ncbi:uncharacterized protein [Miscanthus floridulus]|uniref:uncharacterized protein isoform X2 n=1 Tax=Miscanthus floridulus TaxID=154761 RepID=UPI00345A8961
MQRHGALLPPMPQRCQGRTQCRELPQCAGSREGCQWQALPSPVQCEETATRTRDRQSQMTNTIVMDVPYAELVVQITFFTVINLFHCDKCGCCYNNVMKDSHCCVKRAMYPNCPVCFKEHEKAAKAEARGNEHEVPAKRNDDRSTSP